MCAEMAPSRTFETLLELGKQPALFQRRLCFRKTHRAFQHQGLGFAHLPNRGLDPVPAQLLQPRNPLVTVDHQIPVRLALHGDNHNRHLLTAYRQRRHQPPLPIRTADAKVLQTPLQLMKLQLHPRMLHSPIMPLRRMGTVYKTRALAAP